MIPPACICQPATETHGLALRRDPVCPVHGDLFTDVYDWLAYGVKMGYCSESVCATHDGVPSTPEEQDEWDAGHDPCQHVVRLLHPDEHLSVTPMDYTPSPKGGIAIGESSTKMDV